MPSEETALKPSAPPEETGPRVPYVGPPVTGRDRAMSPEIWWGRLPDPDLVLRRLGRDLAVYREIMHDAHVQSCVISRSAPILKAETRIEPGDSSRAAKKAAERAEKIVGNLDMERILPEIQDAVYYGMSPQEIRWMRNGAEWLPEDLIGRPPEWFCFDQDNVLRFKSRNAPDIGEILEPYVILLHRNRANYSNPYGMRVLSACFWPSAFKKNGFKFWAQFMEKYGMPFLAGKYRRGANADERTEMKDALVAMIQDAVAVIPDDGSVEILTDAGRAASAMIYDKMIERCNSEISKAILSQTLTTEMGQKGGAYAASQTHQEVRQDVVDMDKRLIASGFNQLFRYVGELNDPEGTPPPKLTFFEEADPKTELADRDIKMQKDAGLKFRKGYWCETYGLDEEDFDLVEPAPASPLGALPGAFGQAPQPGQVPPTGTAQDPVGTAEAAGGKSPESEFAETVDPAAVAGLMIDRLSRGGEAEKALNGMRDDVLKIADQAGSYSDFIRELYRRLPNFNLDGLAEELARASFVADCLGRLSAPRPTTASFAESAPLVSAIGLSPEDAIRFFQAKGYQISWNWRDVWRDQHSRSFTVAHCARIDVLADIRGAVNEALKDGRTFAEFRQDLQPRLEAKGWWGKQSGVNPATGQPEDFIAGTPRRLRTIFDTNLTTSYAAGHYKQLRSMTETLPYWQYFTMGDDRVREQHAALNGKVFRADDPIWNTIFPPNGWGCRCWVTPLAQADLDQMGLSVEDGTQIGADGMRELLPEYQSLVSPEFAYNPGQSAWRGVTPEFDDDPDHWVPAGPDNLADDQRIDRIPESLIQKVNASELIDPAGKTDAELVDAFLGKFNAGIGRPVAWKDPMGNSLAISEDLFVDQKRTAEAGETVYKVTKLDRGRYLNLLADTIKDPLEIKVMEGTKRQGDLVFPAPFLKYMKAFQIIGSAGEVQTGFAAFYWDGTTWWGETVFQPQYAQYWETQKGVLVYRKK